MKHKVVCTAIPNQKPCPCIYYAIAVKERLLYFGRLTTPPRDFIPCVLVTTVGNISFTSVLLRSLRDTWVDGTIGQTQNVWSRLTEASSRAWLSELRACVCLLFLDWRYRRQLFIECFDSAFCVHVQIIFREFVSRSSDYLTLDYRP